MPKKNKDKNSPYKFKEQRTSLRCITCNEVFIDETLLHQHVIDTDHNEFAEQQETIITIDKLKF